MSDRDDRLAAEFRALREEEARRAPAFSSFMGSGWAPTRRPPVVRRAAVVLLAAAALTFAVSRTIDGPVSSDLAEELLTSKGLWRGPTDVLLERRSEPLWRSATSRWLRVSAMTREEG